MYTVRLSTRGRIILPVAVRKALGLKPGMRVNVDLVGGAVCVTALPAKKRITLEDIQALLNYSGPTVPISAMRV